MTVQDRRPARELALAIGAALLLFLPGLWAFTLIDPWEGHYAEVGRRIISDADWIHLHWRDEVFRSKPALTPWLIAASLRAHGFTGAYGGELITPLAVWAVRLPFALCGAAGLVSIWVSALTTMGPRVLRSIPPRVRTRMTDLLG